MRDFRDTPDAPPEGKYPGPAAYYQAVHRAFCRAVQSSGKGKDQKICIAGQKIWLRFAGPALVSGIVPALEHLPGWHGGEPDLTIGIWDSSTSGVHLPPPPWAGQVYRVRGKEYSNDEGTVQYHDGRLRMFFYRNEHAMLLDRQERTGIFWVPDAQQIPYHESGAPLRMLFHWWLSTVNRQFVHAAAVGMPDGGALMAGKSGSGKSTSTLACLDSPLRIASDDYCLLEVLPEPRVYSLYNTAKLDSATLGMFPALESKMSNAQQLETEKALFFLQQQFPKKPIPDFPVLALLIPRITGQVNTNLEPATAADGLKALAPSTIFQLSDEGRSSLRVLTRVVRQVPCYHLLLGTDTEQIPETILNLLERKKND